MPRNRLMQRAINLLGSEEKLADATGYTQRAINYATNTGHVSPLMAFRIEAATRIRKKRVNAIDLCPLLDLPRQRKLARRHVNGGRCG